MGIHRPGTPAQMVRRAEIVTRRTDTQGSSNGGSRGPLRVSPRRRPAQLSFEEGQQTGDAAIYWKYGCWSYEGTTDSRALIEGRWDDAENEAGAGSIRLRAWGENAESLIDPLIEALQSLPIGQPPEVKRTKAIGAHAASQSSASVTVRLVSALPVARPTDIVRQDGSKQIDRPAQKTLQDLIFTRDRLRNIRLNMLRLEVLVECRPDVAFGPLLVGRRLVSISEDFAAIIPSSASGLSSLCCLLLGR
jgi:hypothetical protein